MCAGFVVGWVDVVGIGGGHAETGNPPVSLESRHDNRNRFLLGGFRPCSRIVAATYDSCPIR